MKTIQEFLINPGTVRSPCNVRWCEDSGCFEVNGTESPPPGAIWKSHSMLHSDRFFVSLTDKPFFRNGATSVYVVYTSQCARAYVLKQFVGYPVDVENEVCLLKETGLFVDMMSRAISDSQVKREYAIIQEDVGEDLEFYLHHYKHSLSLYHALKLAYSCGKKLNSLHQLGWVHADVKLDNFTVDGRGDVHLIDFGGSMKLPEDKEYKIKLNVTTTKAYRAPEVSDRKRFSFSSDIYSLGKTFEKIFDEVKEVDFNVDAWHMLKELIDQMTHEDYKIRLGLSAVLRKLEFLFDILYSRQMSSLSPEFFTEQLHEVVSPAKASDVCSAFLFKPAGTEELVPRVALQQSQSTLAHK